MSDALGTAAIVLAAGGGTRFEGTGHKLLTEFRGRPLVSWALTAAVGADLDEVAVIVGAVDLGAAVPPGVQRDRESRLGERTGLLAAGRR